MQINIRAKNYELTETIKDYIEEKVSNTAKYLSDINDASVRVEQELLRNEGEVVRVEIALHLASDGEVIVCEDTAGDMHESLDNVIEKLKHAIERYKGKKNQLDKEAVRQLRETE